MPSPHAFAPTPTSCVASPVMRRATSRRCWTTKLPPHPPTPPPSHPTSAQLCRVWDQGDDPERTICWCGLAAEHIKRGVTHRSPCILHAIPYCMVVRVHRWLLEYFMMSPHNLAAPPTLPTYNGLLWCPPTVQLGCVLHRRDPADLPPMYPCLEPSGPAPVRCCCCTVTPRCLHARMRYRTGLFWGWV